MAGAPELSLVIPFYNEACFVEAVVAGHLEAFAAQSIAAELVLVDNGSSDDTPRLCAEAARQEGVTWLRVPENRGYGHGIRQGLAAARGAWLGYTDGDNQIPWGSAGLLYRRARQEGVHLAKAVRSSRQDSLNRRFVSWSYNLLFSLIMGAHIADVNAKPKIFSRQLWESLALQSDDWFIDAELMLACRALPRAEQPIVFAERLGGSSHVRLRAFLEFAANMACHRAFRMDALAVLPERNLAPSVGDEAQSSS